MKIEKVLRIGAVLLKTERNSSKRKEFEILKNSMIQKFHFPQLVRRQFVKGLKKVVSIII